MKPEQALAVLEQATRALSATRDQHAQIIEALKVLAEVVNKQESKMKEINGKV